MPKELAILSLVPITDNEDHRIEKEADGEPDEGKKSRKDQVPLPLYSLSEQTRGSS